MRRLAFALIVFVVVLEAGWMLFDGTRALVVGDYVTPSAGPYAGELGPWSTLVARAGIPPRSTAMKSTFVVYGAVWLAVLLAFVRGRPWAWGAMLAAAIGSLWYLPVGTALSVLQIILLLLMRRE
jgi:hypothetical protein